MKSSIGKRALSIVMSGVLLTGTFTAAFVVPNLAEAETIVLESCNPGLIEFRTNDHLTCIDPDDQSGGGDPYDGTGGGDPSDTRGGGGRPQPRADYQKRMRCKKCKAASQTCQDQGLLAASTCRSNAAAQAAQRCDITTLGAVDVVTAWGCSVSALVSGRCSTAESPWNNRSLWGWECRGSGAVRKCTGEAVDNCIASWRESHGSGSTEIVTTGTASAEFQGVGASSSATITDNYKWDGRLGYLAACSAVGSRLQHKCTARENTCYQDNDCTSADLQ